MARSQAEEASYRSSSEVRASAGKRAKGLRRVCRLLEAHGAAEQGREASIRYYGSELSLLRRIDRFPRSSGSVDLQRVAMG